MKIPLVTELGQNKAELIGNEDLLVYPNGEYIISPYTTVYFEDFLYSGTPFGLLPDLILEEPEVGEILFGDQSCISINLFSSETLTYGSIKKVTGDPLNHKVSCAFKHSANDSNMRDIFFGYESLVLFPVLSTIHVAISGTLVGSDYTLSVDIQNSAGRHTQTLGVVTDTLNTLSIEFTDSNVIFTLNETAITIPNSHPNMPSFADGPFYHPPLGFRVSSSTTFPTTNRVDLDFLKVEKNG